jgi:hypothetical protein
MQLVGIIRTFEVLAPLASAQLEIFDVFNVGRRLASDPRNRNRNDEEVVLEALQRGELQVGHFTVLPPTRAPENR